jgi:hypothetical protein
VKSCLTGDNQHGNCKKLQKSPKSFKDPTFKIVANEVKKLLDKKCFPQVRKDGSMLEIVSILVIWSMEAPGLF